MKRSRSTFGQVVGAYQGDVDTYTALLKVLGETPVCTATASLFSSDFFDDPVCGQRPRWQAFGLHQAGGKDAWLTPVLDAIHYESVSEANNVVYTLDSLGFLDAFNASNGLPIGKRSVLLDSADFVVNLSSTGVSIARNHVFVEVGSLLEPGVPSPTNGYLIAYTAP